MRNSRSLGYSRGAEPNPKGQALFALVVAVPSGLDEQDSGEPDPQSKGLPAVVKDAGLGRALISSETEGNSGGGSAVCRATIDDGVPARRNDVCVFFGLACGITWALDLPLAPAWATNAAPPSYAMPMVGLGALGPSLAAFILAARRGDLRGVFGR